MVHHTRTVEEGRHTYDIRMYVDKHHYYYCIRYWRSQNVCNRSEKAYYLPYIE